MKRNGEYPEGSNKEIQREEIKTRIALLYSNDQEIRRRLQKEPDQQRLAEAIDQENQAQLQMIVERIGWPTISKVGEETAHQAWLLVQHADHDPGWQKHCLELMKAEPAHEVAPADIAYLEDRIRVNEGKPQLFGTQMEFRDGRYQPNPIEDEAGVDERRLAAGMEPLAKYVADFQQAIKK